MLLVFFVFLESNSPPLVDAEQWTNLPGNRKTATSPSVREDESCFLSFRAFKAAGRFVFSCQHLSKRLFFFVPQGLTDWRKHAIHYAHPSVSPLCTSHQQPETKGRFFFFCGGSLFEFNVLTGVRGTARFASEDARRRGAQLMSRPLALHHLCSFQEVVQVLGVQHPRSPGHKLKLSHF